MAVFIYKYCYCCVPKGAGVLAPRVPTHLPRQTHGTAQTSNFLCQTDALAPLGPQHPPHWKPEDARQQNAQRPTRHSRLSTRIRTWPYDSLTQREGDKFHVGLMAAAQRLKFRVPFGPLPVTQSTAPACDPIPLTPDACVLTQLTIFGVKNV